MTQIVNCSFPIELFEVFFQAKCDLNGATFRKTIQGKSDLIYMWMCLVSDDDLMKTINVIYAGYTK